MREDTFPEGNWAVESVQASTWGRPACCAAENHSWNWGMGDEAFRSARLNVPRVNCSACAPWLCLPPGATGCGMCQWLLWLMVSEQESVSYK